MSCPSRCPCADVTRGLWCLIVACVPRQLKYARKNEEFELRRAFVKLDMNNDNKIDADELAAFINSLGHRLKKVRLSKQSFFACVTPVQALSRSMGDLQNRLTHTAAAAESCSASDGAAHTTAWLPAVRGGGSDMGGG